MTDNEERLVYDRDVYKNVVIACGQKLNSLGVPTADAETGAPYLPPERIQLLGARLAATRRALKELADAVKAVERHLDTGHALSDEEYLRITTALEVAEEIQ